MGDDLSSRLYQEHIVRMQNLQDRQRMKVIEEAQAIEEKRVGRSPASAGQKTPTGEGQRWETMYSEGHFLQTYKREVPEDYKPSEMKAVEVAREKHEREKAIRREFARSAHDLDYDQIKGKIDIEDIIQPGVAKTPEERKKKKEAEDDKNAKKKLDHLKMQLEGEKKARKDLEERLQAVPDHAGTNLTSRYQEEKKTMDDKKVLAKMDQRFAQLQEEKGIRKMNDKQMQEVRKECRDLEAVERAKMAYEQQKGQW